MEERLDAMDELLFALAEINEQLTIASVCAFIITCIVTYFSRKEYLYFWSKLNFMVVTAEFVNRYRVGMDTKGYGGTDLFEFLLQSPLLKRYKVLTLFLWQFKEVNDKYSQEVFKRRHFKKYIREVSLYYPPRGDKYKTLQEITEEYNKSILMNGDEVNNEMIKFLQEHISVSSNKVESMAVCQLFYALSELKMFNKQLHVFVKEYIPEHFPTLAFTSYSAISAMNSASIKESADVKLLMSRIQNAVKRQVESTRK